MPEAPFNPVEYWRRHTRQLRDGLLRRIDDLSVSDYPEAAAHSIIRFLLVFLTELDHKIDKAATEDELKFIGQLIQGHGMFLQWLDNAHTGQTPRALAHMLKTLMDRLEPNSGVVAVPQAEYNYSIRDLTSHLKGLVDNWIPQSRHHVFQEFNQSPTKLISFPRIERDNLLAHAIFGHELGHPIADQFIQHEASTDKYRAAQTVMQKSVVELVEKHARSSNMTGADKLAMTTQIFQEVLQVRQRALEELVSDAVGILLFGPSAFFAMYELLWHANWDRLPTASEWYPPSRMRVRLMLQQLDSTGGTAKLLGCEDERAKKYIFSVRAFLEQARALVAIESDQAGISSAPAVSLAYTWMNESLPEALQFAKDKVGDVAYDLDAGLAQLPELLQRLELGVPPNEIGDPLAPKVVDFRSSLLAAWTYKLGARDVSSGEPLVDEQIDRLNLQTLLAVEYVILRDKYGDHLKAHA